MYNQSPTHNCSTSSTQINLDRAFIALLSWSAIQVFRPTAIVALTNCLAVHEYDVRACLCETAGRTVAG